MSGRSRQQQHRMLFVSFVSIASLFILLNYKLPVYIRRYDDEVILPATVGVKKGDNVKESIISNTNLAINNEEYDHESFIEWGGVLPIRRFQMKSNTGIVLRTFSIKTANLERTATLTNSHRMHAALNSIFDISSSLPTSSILNYSTSMKQCNKQCLKRNDCDAWEFHFSEILSVNSTCTLFAQPYQNLGILSDNRQKSSSLSSSSSNMSPVPPPYGPGSSCGRPPFTKPCPKHNTRNDDNFSNSPRRTSFLAAHQAPNNDINYAVGFVQRHARVLTRRGRMKYNDDDSGNIQKKKFRRRGTTKKKKKGIGLPHNQEKSVDDGPLIVYEDTIVSNRVLVVLHYHHSIPSHDHLYLLVNTLLRSTFSPTLFDLVIITPQPEPLPLSFQNITNTTKLLTLVNPLVPKDEQSKYGSSSYMSLPIAYAKFPGYKGYLLMNDDVSIRMFDLIKHPEIWFNKYPWCTEATRKPREPLPRMEQITQASNLIVRNDKAYEGWKWWNKDSGSTTWPPPHLSLSNFDAALAALNEFCEQSLNTVLMSSQDESRRDEFCGSRASTTLAPSVHSKGDVLYVPNIQSTSTRGDDKYANLGLAEMKSLKLFGEHDVFLEVAIPMVYNLVVPDNLLLSAPYCNLLPQKFVPHLYQPVYSREGEFLSELRCSVLHPLKFSEAENVRYWQSIIEAECGNECKRNSEVGWQLRPTPL